MQADKSEVCEKIRKNEDISIEAILQIVATHYKLTINEFCSATKRPAAVRARNAVIWLAVKHLGLTPKELSGVIGLSPSTISGIISSRKGENDYDDILLGISPGQRLC
jgi:chromosomal replication initiation ATPase DnaA